MSDIEKNPKRELKLSEDESSSSESDIENYLQKPEDLNLNSSFFKITPKKAPDNEQFEQSKATLSESDSDVPLDYYTTKEDSVGASSSNNEVQPEEPGCSSFHDTKIFDGLNNQANELEEAKKQVEAYLAKRKSQVNDDTGVNEILAIGEKPFDLAKDLAEVGFHPSDFESGSGSENEKEDWQEVNEKEPVEKNIIPKDGVQVTVEFPNAAKKKKHIDLMAALKRRMNRIKKENQVFVHKVHLLCWIAHGNYVNSVLNKDIIMSLALSLLPSKESYPPERTNLKYLEQITRWYSKSFKYTQSETSSKKKIDLEERLKDEMKNKSASSVNNYVYIFIAILRALGMSCRLVLSLRTEPLKPASSDLLSLSTKTEPPKNNTKSEKEKSVKKAKSDTNGGSPKQEKLNIKQANKRSKSADLKADSLIVKDNNKRSKSASMKTKEGESPNMDDLNKRKTKSISTRSKVKSANKLNEAKALDMELESENKMELQNHKELQIGEKLKITESESQENKDKNKLKAKSATTRRSKPKSPNISTEATEEEIKSQTSKSRLSLRKLRSNLTQEANLPNENDTEKKGIKRSIPAPKKLKPNLSKIRASSNDSKHPKKDNDCVTSGTASQSRSSTSRVKNVKGTEENGTKGKRQLKSKISQTQSKSKLELSIDETLATLEALEKPTSSTKIKETLKNTTLKITDSSTDDDILDRSAWRRSKSLSPMIINKKPLSQSTAEENSNLSGRRTRSRAKNDAIKPNAALIDSVFETTDDETRPPNKKNKILIKLPRIPKKVVSQIDGHDDSLDSWESNSDVDIIEEEHSIFNTLCCNPRNLLLVPQNDGFDDPDCISKARSSPEKKPARSTNLKMLKTPPSGSKQEPKEANANTSTFFSPKNTSVEEDIVHLIKKSIREGKSSPMKKRSPNKKEYDYDSDSDFVSDDSTPPKKKKHPPGTKVKRRVYTKKQLEALVKQQAEIAKTKPKGFDIWVEVFLEEEEKWISADVIHDKVHCVKDLYAKASHPISYILSWDNINRVKDITARYCLNWNTVTRKLRVDSKWWADSLKGFVGKKTARDKDEDEDLARQQLDQPLPKTISEYKGHPLYVLKRHLLKFEAIYPPDAAILGFVRKEEVYSRDCVYTLHSREIWLKHAKTVKPGEQPYKIVKARPKYDKLSNSMITDQLLEIFGVWQVQDYDPPSAENGVVPRNAYGNVELFKPCMLPKKCVHLQLPGLNKIARKLNIDCAPAVVGFDFHGGWNHAVYDGFIVCEEFKETLITSWENEQEEIVKREQEKYEKRVFGNWRRLIKAALIRERLKKRYDFAGENKQLFPEDVDDINELERSSGLDDEKKPPVKKRPKFMSRK